MYRNSFQRNSRLLTALVFVFVLGTSACGLIPLVQATQTVQPSQTPGIQIEDLPTLPVLGTVQPTVTPQPTTQVYYEDASSIFSRQIYEILPEAQNQNAAFSATVNKASEGLYSVTHKSGTSYDVACDDFCFCVDDGKRAIDCAHIKNGMKVVVYGVSDEEDPSIINADALAVNTKRAQSGMTKADMSTLPYGIEYHEYELKSAPSVNPLVVEPVEGDLTENLAQWGQKSLSERTFFTYGLYGESYKAYAEYYETNNRDPSHPTRAKMLVLSNEYEFFDFWFPYVESPMLMNWGILSLHGEWYLPFRMTVDIDPDPIVTEIIYSDHTIKSQLVLDKQKDYLRSFGTSVYGSTKLFYFYEKEGGFGFSLDYVDYDLAFDEIPFGMLGKYEALNPFYSDDLVAFYARRGSKWYYVELTYPEWVPLYG